MFDTLLPTGLDVFCLQQEIRKYKLNWSEANLWFLSCCWYDKRRLVYPPFKRQVTLQEPSKTRMKSLEERKINLVDQAWVWSRRYGIKTRLFSGRDCGSAGIDHQS